MADAPLEYLQEGGLMLLAPYDMIVSPLLIEAPFMESQTRLLWPEHHWLPDAASYERLLPRLKRYGYHSVVLSLNRFPQDVPGGTPYPSAPLSSWGHYDIAKMHAAVAPMPFAERPHLALVELRFGHTQFLQEGLPMAWLSGELRHRNFSLHTTVSGSHYDDYRLFPNDGDPLAINYLPSISRLRYLIAPTFLPSAGQYIAEAAIYDVIVLSRPHRLNFKMLYPPFWAISSLSEALEKIDELEGNLVLRAQVLDHMRRHRHLIDLGSVPSAADLLKRTGIERLNEGAHSPYPDENLD